MPDAFRHGMGKARVIGRVTLLAKPSAQGSPKRFCRIAADILPVEGFDGTEVAFALTMVSSAG